MQEPTNEKGNVKGTEQPPPPLISFLHAVCENLRRPAIATQPIAASAAGDDVVGVVAAALAARHEVLCCHAQLARLSGGDQMPSRELNEVALQMANSVVLADSAAAPASR